MAVNLLLVGRNGNGKSSIGNSILGAKFFASNSYRQSSIDNIKKANNKVDGTIITVVDGPFINDTNLNDPDDIKLALECGEKAMQLCPDGGFHAVVIILRYGVRFTQQEKDTISFIRAVFGENVIKDHGICAFSYGDSFARDVEEDGVSFENWCMNQTGDVADLFKECRNKYVIFNNRDDGSKQFQRDTLLSYVDRLRGKGYTSNEYLQAETGRKELQVMGKRRRLEEETRKVLDDISVALRQIDIHGDPDYSRNQFMAMKEKLEKHKAYLEQHAAGTHLLDNIFINIKVTEMNLDTKLRLADVILEKRQHEQRQRPLQDEESTHCLLESRQGKGESSSCKATAVTPVRFSWETVISGISWAVINAISWAVISGISWAVISGIRRTVISGIRRIRNKVLRAPKL
ncbi:hypothetical protein BsWGS_12385 [Bradybaena similaris]